LRPSSPRLSDYTSRTGLTDYLKLYGPTETTWRTTTGCTPYELVYGKRVLFPIETKIQTLRTIVQLGMDLTEAQKQRLLQINELDELRQASLHHTIVIQHQRAQWHDKFIKKKKFKVGDWALLFDSKFKYFRGKFHTRWLGPYEIDIVYDNGAIKLHTIDDERTPLMENGHMLRLYHRPLSKEAFLKRITSGWPDNDLEIVNKGGTPTE
jgi:hypothetical protein